MNTLDSSTSEKGSKLQQKLAEDNLMNCKCDFIRKDLKILNDKISINVQVKSIFV